MSVLLLLIIIPEIYLSILDCYKLSIFVRKLSTFLIQSVERQIFICTHSLIKYHEWETVFNLISAKI